MKVVLTAKSGNEFLERIKETEIRLDIIILDLRMENGNGLEVMEQLPNISSGIKTIILSTFYRRSFMGQMLKNGANAFLPKEIDGEDLIQVIESVDSNGHYFSEEQVEVMRKQLAPKLPTFHLPQKDGLTEREISILQLLCQQLNTREIGEKLFISPKTVETHKSNLIVKAGVKNMAGLVIYAVQNRIIDPSEIVLLDR